jgi:hypothetical protein
MLVNVIGDDPIHFTRFVSILFQCNSISWVVVIVMAFKDGFYHDHVSPSSHRGLWVFFINRPMFFS